jgi:hypothetical protein
MTAFTESLHSVTFHSRNEDELPADIHQVTDFPSMQRNLYVEQVNAEMKNVSACLTS